MAGLRSLDWKRHKKDKKLDSPKNLARQGLRTGELLWELHIQSNVARHGIRTSELWDLHIQSNLARQGIQTSELWDLYIQSKHRSTFVFTSVFGFWLNFLYMSVTGQPARNEKYLSCIASGKWVLHKSFFEACRKEGKFARVSRIAQPRKFELFLSNF